MEQYIFMHKIHTRLLSELNHYNFLVKNISMVLWRMQSLSQSLYLYSMCMLCRVRSRRTETTLYVRRRQKYKHVLPFIIFVLAPRPAATRIFLLVVGICFIRSSRYSLGIYFYKKEYSESSVILRVPCRVLYKVYFYFRKLFIYLFSRSLLPSHTNM